jgi:hypothetical protein
MTEKSQLQILCEEKIPRLLNGESPSEVFKDYAQSLPKCTEYKTQYPLGDDFGEFLYPK